MAEQIDWAEHVALAAAAQRLDIPEAYREGVVANVQRIAAIAERLLAVRLSDDDEPAPVFTP